jgi:hypothetical protein
MALSMIRKMVTRTSVLLLFFWIFIISWCTKTNNFTKQYTYWRDILEFTNSNWTHRWRGAKKIDTIITVTHVRSWSQQQDTMEYNNVTYSWDLTFISIKNIKLQEDKKRDFICSKEKITKNKYTIHTNTSIDIFWKILNDIIPLKSKKWDSWWIISNSSCIIWIISQSVSWWTKILPIGDNF